MKLSDSAYIQKSKCFLLPLIEVRMNNKIKPVNTYIRDDIFTEYDYKLILPFKRDESGEFYFYERELLESPCFDTDNYYETKQHQVYVFDLSRYEEDFKRFLAGKYTTFSTKSKSLINMYWGKPIERKFEKHPRIECYLNPGSKIHDGQSGYERMSQELGVSVTLLETVKELLDRPDMKKETFNVEDRFSKIRSEGGDSVESSPL